MKTAYLLTLFIFAISAHARQRQLLASKPQWVQPFTAKGIEFVSFAGLGNTHWAAGFILPDKQQFMSGYGKQGKLYLSIDGGKSFKEITKNLPKKSGIGVFKINKIVAISETSAVAVGIFGRSNRASKTDIYPAIIRTTNKGQTWKIVYQTKVNLSFDNGGIADVSIAPGSSGKVLWSTGPFSDNQEDKFVFKVLKSTDAGATWSEVLFPNLAQGPNGMGFMSIQRVAAVNAKEAWFAGNTQAQGTTPLGFLFKTTTGGQTWEGVSVTMPVEATYYSLIVTQNNIILSGQARVGPNPNLSPIIIASKDKGATWKLYQTQSNNGLVMQVARKDEKTLLAVDGLNLLMSQDNGQSWKPQPIKQATGNKFKNLIYPACVNSKFCYFASTSDPYGGQIPSGGGGNLVASWHP